MRRASSLAVVVPSILVLAACRGDREGTSETITWKGPIKAGATFAYLSRDGSLTVEEGSADSAELVVKVRRRSDAVGSGRLTVLQDGDGLIACIIFKDGQPCTREGYAAADWNARGIDASATLTLPRGHKVDVQTSNGSVKVLAPTAEARVSTSNGSVTVTDVAGLASVSTSNGSVRVKNVRGAIDVSTSNGSVRLTLDTIAGPITAASSNGSITAYLPTSASAKLAMSTSNGTATLDLPGNVTSKTPNAIEAMLGGGAFPVTLTSSNARVRVLPNRGESGDDDDH
ncbi:MAG: DUF4097 domain-containing protein [Gemmatimonadaceae bacterium]|jgi:hypothetical protein|nr:DUF4097 domain-containing protein [Gemmatimonadaceae bacterium]